MIKIRFMFLKYLILFFFIVTNSFAGRDQQNCEADRPCIDNIYQDGNSIVVEWFSMNGYDHYNVRWEGSDGSIWRQREIPGGYKRSDRLNHVLEPGVGYSASIQGCKKPLIGDSDCSPWTVKGIDIGESESSGDSGTIGEAVGRSMRGETENKTMSTTMAEGTVQDGVNLQGYDYGQFEAWEANDCVQRCSSDNHCRAWTFVKPGTEKPSGHCWLKEQVASPTPCDRCISGIKASSSNSGGFGNPSNRTIRSNIEDGINLQGYDYRQFQAWDLNACVKECSGDYECRAWTFVKPGTEEPSGHCWLKNQISSPTPCDRCISGVK
jgi:hypothetical protein